MTNEERMLRIIMRWIIYIRLLHEGLLYIIVDNCDVGMESMLTIKWKKKPNTIKGGTKGEA